MTDVHWLTNPLEGLHRVEVVCRTPAPERGTWHLPLVSCPRCLAQSQRLQTTTSPGATIPESEKTFLARVRQLARLRGWLTFHPLVSRGSEPGWVDLTCVRPPILVLAELKTTTGQLTPAQRLWIDRLRQVEQVKTAVWRPNDWPDIEETLR